MINRIQIKNFMHHKKQDITFSPFVNVIIGENAAGKSTILRAIKYASRNTPSGDSVINWDSEKTVVRITEGKNKITRIRGKGINLYKLNKKKYKAFGTGVPEDIQKILGLSDINFQGQHDAPFWFCEKPPEVSRQLNVIVNLDVIDTTLSNIDSKMRETRTIIKVISSRLEAAKERQAELKYTKEMDRDLKNIESLGKQLKKKAIERSTIADLLKSMQIYANQQKNSSDQVSCGKIALKKGKQLRRTTENIEKLTKLLVSYKKYKRIINNRPPSFEPIILLRKRKIKIAVKISNLKIFIEEIKERENNLWLLKRNLKENLKKLKLMIKNKCPLCGTKTKKL